jgi:hypothetical protein
MSFFQYVNVLTPPKSFGKVARYSPEPLALDHLFDERIIDIGLAIFLNTEPALCLVRRHKVKAAILRSVHMLLRSQRRPLGGKDQNPVVFQHFVKTANPAGPGAER